MEVIRTMNYKEILRHLTGFSVPIFGISWNPPEPEVAVARRIIAFLENRRVLFNPYHLEVADQCARSVCDVRERLSTEIGQLSDKSELAQHLRGIRAACRKFLDDIGYDAQQGNKPYPVNHTFFAKLGEFRSTIGIHIAAIPVMHGLDVEGSLAGVLPALPDEDGN